MNNLIPLSDKQALATANASTIAKAIQDGEVSAREITEIALERIETLDGRYNSFTAITAERALAEAAAVDNARSKGLALPPLAGVPYAVKNLFDVTGLVTLAGSIINANNTPATKDALLVQAMHRAGAILLGALNMDEYAYGFTTENSHYGVTHNPHNPARSAGGSSGGCGASVAAGLVALSLGSDTNGSVRVPSSMCGIFGLKPTYGNLSLQGMFPFVHSLDHAGIFARSTTDLCLCYDILNTASHPSKTIETTKLAQIKDLRIAIAADYFEQGDAQANAAITSIADCLGISRKITLPEVARARSAAYIITASEGGALHQHRLRTRASDFDPHTRPRLLAGNLIPASWAFQAQRFRRWFYEQMMCVFNDVDIILAPATPCSAQLLGQTTMSINGIEMPTRPNIGMFTQPISFIGLPVVTVPIQQSNGMPIGVQIIAPPWREDLALSVAAYVESLGVASAPVVTN
jgi:1-carboxybiuret hydrolase